MTEINDTEFAEILDELNKQIKHPKQTGQTKLKNYEVKQK